MQDILCQYFSYVKSVQMPINRNALNRVTTYTEWPHSQGGCLACCGCTFDSAEVALIYTMHEALRGYFPCGYGCDQSNGSTVSDAIVRSWLWLTATRCSPLGCFSKLLQVVDN